MTKRKFCLSLLLMVTLLGLFPSAILAQPAGEGIIQGQVANKTPNGKSVSDISLELKTFVDGNEKGSAKTQTDAQGKFRFSGLSTESTYTYVVSLNYQEADYESQSVSFGKGETNKSLEITVWDATDSDTAIKIAAAHVVVQFESEGLKVTEYYRIENQGDKNYVGSKLVSSLGKKETLRFSLPTGFQVHQLALGLMECCVAFEDSALVDTMGVEPGMKEIAFIYTLTFSATTYTFPIVPSLPTDNFNLVVEDKGIQVFSPQLSPPQSTMIESNRFLLLGKKDLKKGETIQVTLSGLPRSSPMGSLRWVGGALIAIALVFGVVYPIMRRRPSPVRLEHQEDREQLLQEVAQLDDAFEAGQVSEDEYLRLRSQKMARLMALSREKQ